MNGAPSYLHADTRGSSRLINNGACERAERRISRPFGGMVSVDEDAAVEGETRGWIGERYDAGAGLQYLGRATTSPNGFRSRRE